MLLPSHCCPHAGALYTPFTVLPSPFAVVAAQGATSGTPLQNSIEGSATVDLSDSLVAMQQQLTTERGDAAAAAAEQAYRMLYDLTAQASARPQPAWPL